MQDYIAHYSDHHPAPQQQLDEAVAVLLRLQTHGDPALEEHLYAAWLRKVQALHQLGQHQASADAADALVAHVADDAGGLRARWVAEALTRKGLALREIGNTEAEMAAYAEVQSRYDDATTPEVRLWLAHAGFEHNMRRAGLGGTFSKVDVVRNCEALAERFGADALLATRVVAARARAFRAFVLDGLGYHKDALDIYQKLQSDFSQAPEPELRLQAAQAGFSLAQSLAEGADPGDAADPQAAIAAWAGLLARYGGEGSADMRALLAAAAFRRADALDDEGEHVLALQACDGLLEAHGHEAAVDVVVHCCRALLLKVHILQRDDRPVHDNDAGGAGEEAQGLYDTVIARYGLRSEAPIRRLVGRAYWGRVVLADTPEKECAVCDEMIESLEGHAADPQIDVWLARAWLVKGRAQRRLGLEHEALLTLDGLLARFDASADPSVALQAARARMSQAFALDKLGRGAEEQTTYLQLADRVAALRLVQRNAGGDLPDELRAEGAAALRLLAGELGQPAAEAALPAVNAPAPLQRADVVQRLLSEYAADPAPEVRRQTVLALYDWAVGLREQQDFEGALSAYDLLLAHFADDSSEPVRRTVASALLNKAYLLLKLMDRPEAALVVYDDIMARYKNATSADLRDTLAKAAASRHTCLNTLNKTSAADFGGDFPDLPIAERDAVRDKIARARALSDERKPREAVALLDEVLAAHVESSHPELRRQCARAMLNKAYQLVEPLGQYVQAIVCIDEMEARYGADLSTEMQEKVAQCLQYKTTALDKLGRHDEELALYDNIVARWGGSNVLDLRERVAEALYRKGLTLRQAGDSDTALAHYDAVISRVGAAREPVLQRIAARAWLSKAWALGLLGDAAGECAAHRELIDRYGASTDTVLRQRLVDAHERLAAALGKLGQRDAQLAVLEAAIANFADIMPVEQHISIKTALAGLQAVASVSSGVGAVARKLLSRVWRGR